ncbi:MAG: hypothetical protein M4579_003110 [Chaenotheca gracillima]|nr:MAG: hypothetical protein M4579_003110 [Chaenotheca gracillima]
MVDKRSLRSNKPDGSNGDANGSSQPDSNGQDRPAPARAPSSKTKTVASKKGTSNDDAQDTGDQSQRTNGVQSNGTNGSTEDVEMGEGEDNKPNGKGKGKDADGDEEMTVVVPPSKGSKLSANGKQDKEGDVAMDEPEKSEDATEEEEEVDPVVKAIQDVKANYVLLDRAVAQFDARFSLRVLRSISSIRKSLTPEILANVITQTYPSYNPTAKILLQTIGEESAFDKLQNSSEMDVDSDTTKTHPSKTPVPKEALPEVDIYLSILTQIHLLDTKAIDVGARFSSDLVKRIHELNRRTLDALSARAYFYYSLFHEQLQPLPPSPSSPVVQIRQQLLAALRTSVLRKDVDIQATVTTLLLRNYLSTSHVSQADLLVSHTQFPPTASNNQIARFLYFLGRIRAIQLSYTEAHEHLTGATRKSPSNASAAGFYQASTKLLIVVELLMGDIPDRAIFRQPTLERALQPYFLLVRAVRVGDLEGFSKIVQAHHETFRRDSTYTLILRLRQNVIKTGIRMMSLSYSRISLRDICVRLGLGSEESAEYIVAKAIRDGVIEASLDHERGFMKSKEIGDIYATREPGEAFHDRIRACLGLHDESIKAMRFPMNQHRLELKNAQEARERERELAKEIQEGDIDDDDAGGDFEGMIDVSIRLRRAIHLNDLLLVKRITSSHPRLLRNPDYADKSNTSLHTASKLGLLEIVEYLVNAGHENEFVSQNTDGDTPLRLACEGGHEPVVRLLLRHFWRCVGWQNKAGTDVLADVSLFKLMISSKLGHASICELLLTFTDTLDLVLPPSRRDSEVGRSSLSRSSVSSNTSDLPSSPPLSSPSSSASSSSPSMSPNRHPTDLSRHRTLSTPSTSKYDFPANAALFPAAPTTANPNAQDTMGNTALHFASAYGQLKAIRVLLAHGASPTLRNHYSWKPVSYSATVQAEVYFNNLVNEGINGGGGAGASGGPMGGSIGGISTSSSNNSNTTIMGDAGPPTPTAAAGVSFSPISRAGISRAGGGVDISRREFGPRPGPGARPGTPGGVGSSVRLVLDPESGPPPPPPYDTPTSRSFSPDRGGPPLPPLPGAVGEARPGTPADSITSAAPGTSTGPTPGVVGADGRVWVGLPSRDWDWGDTSGRIRAGSG